MANFCSTLVSLAEAGTAAISRHSVCKDREFALHCLSFSIKPLTNVQVFYYGNTYLHLSVLVTALILFSLTSESVHHFLIH